MYYQFFKTISIQGIMALNANSRLLSWYELHENATKKGNTDAFKK